MLQGSYLAGLDALLSSAASLVLVTDTNQLHIDICCFQA